MRSIITRWDLIKNYDQAIDSRTPQEQTSPTDFVKSVKSKFKV